MGVDCLVCGSCLRATNLKIEYWADIELHWQWLEWGSYCELEFDDVFASRVPCWYPAQELSAAPLFVSTTPFVFQDWLDWWWRHLWSKMPICFRSHNFPPIFKFTVNMFDCLSRSCIVIRNTCLSNFMFLGLMIPSSTICSSECVNIYMWVFSVENSTPFYTNTKIE